MVACKRNCHKCRDCIASQKIDDRQSGDLDEMRIGKSLSRSQASNVQRELFYNGGVDGSDSLAYNKLESVLVNQSLNNALIDSVSPLDAYVNSDPNAQIDSFTVKPYQSMKFNSPYVDKKKQVRFASNSKLVEYASDSTSGSNEQKEEGSSAGWWILLFILVIIIVGAYLTFKFYQLIYNIIMAVIDRIFGKKEEAPKQQ